MLAFERWTLTQSLGWAAVLVGLALALPLGLLLGLAAMNASREAETVAAGELCDDDGDAEPVWDGELVGEVDDADADADDDGEPEPALALDGGGDNGVLVGVLLVAGAVGEAEVDVDEVDGDGDGEGDFVGGGSAASVSACSPSAVPRTEWPCSRPCSRWRRCSSSARPPRPSPCLPVRHPASPRARRG